MQTLSLAATNETGNKIDIFRGFIYETRSILTSPISRTATILGFFNQPSRRRKIFLILNINGGSYEIAGTSLGCY